jgi:hypothetical protein
VFFINKYAPQSPIRNYIRRDGRDETRRQQTTKGTIALTPKSIFR